VSGALSRECGDGVPSADSATLGFMRESGLTVALEAAQLRRLQAVMSAAVRAGEDAAAELREITGPEAAGIAEQIVRMMLMGAGYFRAGSDTVDALFRERAKVRLAKKKTARRGA
jgi:hypothetical protein